MNINGTIAIVTGAASGLGAATADLLEKNGCTVARWDINAARHIIACDVTSEDSVKAALTQSDQPRILVNCAGVLIGKRLVNRESEPADLDHFHRTLHVNLLGTYNVMRLAAAAMSKLEPIDADGTRGVIINTASIAAFEGQIGQVAYAASKGGVAAMTLPAARDLAKSGIRVMCIAPGAVATPMMAGVKDENRASIEASIPFPSRFAKPEEFAKLVLHIIDNDMLNGETIRLDGASRLASK